MKEGFAHWVSSQGTVDVVTRGFIDLGHPELAFFVRPSDDVPGDVVREHLGGLVDMLADAARRGQILQHGAALRVPDEVDFLHPDVVGVLFMDPLGGFPEVPPGTLLGLTLLADEWDWFTQVGPYRVATRIGQDLHAFPFPLVSSWERPSAVRPGDDQSVLHHLPRVSFPGLTLTLADQTLHVEVPRGLGEDLAEVLDDLPDPVFALSAHVSTRADARLSWVPGQSGVVAISPPSSAGESVAGGQLVAATDPSFEDDLVGFLEDGFHFNASPATWAAFVDAFVHERPFTLPGAGGRFGLSLSFVSPPSRDFIELLLPEEQIAQGVALAELSDYIRALDALLEGASQAVVTVELTPGHDPTFEVSGGLPDAITEVLAQVPAPQVRAPVPFAIHKG
jgi:hypothetical protein